MDKPVINENEKDNELMVSQMKALFPDMQSGQVFDFPMELIANADINNIYDQSKKIIGMMVEYKELMMMYDCAIKKIRTKLEILDTEFNARYQRNPINSIVTRLKNSKSIIEKMGRNDIPFTLENIEANIHDIAGIRVICPYVDDIYQITDALIKQDDIQLIGKKDYIENPKPNGYRSMHLIVSTPVYFAEHTKHMKAEIQIRTIAMDFWATLEHQLRYKNLEGSGEEISAQLKECADIITDTDLKMLEIRKRIEADTHEPSEEDVLLEKVQKLIFP